MLRLARLKSAMVSGSPLSDRKLTVPAWCSCGECIGSDLEFEICCGSFEECPVRDPSRQIVPRFPLQRGSLTEAVPCTLLESLDETQWDLDAVNSFFRRVRGSFVGFACIYG